MTRKQYFYMAGIILFFLFMLYLHIVFGYDSAEGEFIRYGFAGSVVTSFWLGGTSLSYGSEGFVDSLYTLLCPAFLGFFVGLFFGLLNFLGLM